MSFYYTFREALRLNPAVKWLVYNAQSLIASRSGRVKKAVHALDVGNRSSTPQGVAICVRIKDEAASLQEWLDYHLAAGVEHFYIYESFSTDNFQDVLAPYVQRGIVTLIANYPHIPVTPSAEEDCVLRALPRFEWLGFLDADEFVVIRDGSSIGEFLGRYRNYPAVALHWLMFGSNGHVQRPSGSIIMNFVRRKELPDWHIKSFVRPAQVTQCRNPHSWFYRGVRHAVTEHRRAVHGSNSTPPSADLAWINHYHCKSEAEYLAKMNKKEACDQLALVYQRRSQQSFQKSLWEYNEVEDRSAVEYYRARCAALHQQPRLLAASEAPRAAAASSSA